MRQLAWSQPEDILMPAADTFQFVLIECLWDSFAGAFEFTLHTLEAASLVDAEREVRARVLAARWPEVSEAAPPEGMDVAAALWRERGLAFHLLAVPQPAPLAALPLKSLGAAHVSGRAGRGIAMRRRDATSGSPPPPAPPPGLPSDEG